MEITPFKLRQRLEALLLDIRRELLLERLQDHEITGGKKPSHVYHTDSSHDPNIPRGRASTYCYSTFTGSQGSSSCSSVIKKHGVLCGNVRESKHLESTIKMIEKERREVIRQYNVLKDLEKRKLKKIVTQVASRVSAAQKLRRSSDRSLVAIAPPPTPIATSTPVIKKSGSELNKGLRMAAASSAGEQLSSARHRSDSRREDKMVATCANFAEQLNFKEAKQSMDNRSSSLAETEEDESLQERRRLVKLSQNSRRPSLTLPPLYLLPRASLNCDRLSRDAINQLENSKEKPPVRRRLFSVDVTNTRLALR